MKIYHQALLRVPQFPLNASLKEEWEILKSSIQLASTDFYEQIRHVTADELNQLPRAIYHTIWKYFNRAKYRATPFGTFAGCGLVNLDKETDQDKIIIDAKQITHAYPCWTITSKLTNQQEVITNDTIVFANQTYYQVGNNIRFIGRENDAFTLVETEGLESYVKVLEQSKRPITVSKLLNTLDGALIADLQDMIDLQLLFTSNTPNILGNDYFNRIGYTATEDDPQYVLAERKILQSTLSAQHFSDLPELFSLLQHLVPDPPSYDLNRFKSAFTRKFEDRTVPLIVALDPELGISYGNLDLATGLNAPIEEPPKAELNDKRALIEMLFRQMVASGCKVIQLDQLPAPEIKGALSIPGSLGVLCSQIDDLLVIEQIASPSSNRLLGRFSMIGKDIENLCQDLAAYESAANPDILFFDIGYTDEVTVDNVNRRRSIYPYQLSLLNYDDSGAALDLSDIDITISGNEIILYDRRLRKRIIPRLSSGYNYKRSHLSIYRFLNDLQYDGLKINFNLKLSDSFPGEDYYPRVQYKQIILSPAQWRVSAAALKSQVNGIVDANRLCDYLRSIGLKRYAVTRTEDRTMVFDLESNADLKELLHLLSKFDSFLLEEGLIPKHPLVEDDIGNGYAHQFVLSLVNNRQFYHPGINPATATIPLGKVQTIFPPTDEWIYFEIYAHPIRIDELLKGPIPFILNKLRDKIKSWFFVRYDENGTHLRLRPQLKQQSSLPEIISKFNSLLQEDVITGVIRDVKIATYKREIERYGADLISAVESHYCKDSEYVLSLLHQEINDDQKYQLCIKLLHILLNAMGDKAEDGRNYIDQVCYAFADEYRLTSIKFKELNNHYRRLSKITPAMEGDTYKLFKTFTSSAKSLLKQCPTERRLKLIADLFHMHVNRIFPSHQRSHEMMIYYFCQKALLQKATLEKLNLTHYHQK
jgi:thiopeptide-type bacteriocin biosynthesis protein